MRARISTVIRCSDLVGEVHATLESVERQTLGGGGIVLVTDASTPAPARDWLLQLARARRVLTTDAPSPRPGAVRNAGVRATQAPNLLCLDAGDRLDSRCHALVCAALERDPDVSLVTTGLLVLGPGSGRRIIGPGSGDIEDLVAGTDSICGASVFRRDDWIALQGFDEALAGLDDYDFWLRLLQLGRRAARIDHPLLIRRLREGALYRRAWEPERHVEAVRQLVEKHATLFGMDPARALHGRELVLRDLGDEYRSLIDRRDAAVRELASLGAQADRIRQSLTAAELDRLDLGDLRRTTPVSRNWGYERGVPVDRYFIERFLEEHAADIRGAVLEVQEPDYTRRFGGHRVVRSDVVNLNPSNTRANIVADLRSAANIETGTYDCVILTQTLHVVDDMQAVVRECQRILKPGGVLLATLPSASRVCLEYRDEGDFWRVTEAGARRLSSTVFPIEDLDVQARGNVLVNTAFLYGLGCHELTQEQLDAVDPYFPLLVTVRGRKAGAAERPMPTRARDQRHRPDGAVGAAILLYHRVGAPESDVHGLSIPARTFREQMTHLCQRYYPMPLDALVAAVRNGQVPPGAIAVTFDDGYLDNDTNASPILSELGVPATFFVTTERLDDAGYEYWWDALERILLSSASPLPDELRLALPDGSRTFATRSREQRLAAHLEIYHAIVGIAAGARGEAIGALERWSGLGKPVHLAHRRLTGEEIAALAAREGHAIGAHSVRHLMLPRQPAEVQREEIEASRRALETLLARRVSAFAYPFGAFSEQTIDLVRAASFDAAVTCEEERPEPGSDLLRLPRFEVTPARSAQFAEWLDHRISSVSS